MRMSLRSANGPDREARPDGADGDSERSVHVNRRSDHWAALKESLAEARQVIERQRAGRG